MATTARNAIVEFSSTTGLPTGLAWIDGVAFTGVSTEVGAIPPFGAVTGNSGGAQIKNVYKGMYVTLSSDGVPLSSTGTTTIIVGSVNVFNDSGESFKTGSWTRSSQV